MMVRWSGEVQVNVCGMSNLNLSLTLVDMKLVYFVVVQFKRKVSTSDKMNSKPVWLPLFCLSCLHSSSNVLFLSLSRMAYEDFWYVVSILGHIMALIL